MWEFYTKTNQATFCWLSNVLAQKIHYKPIRLIGLIVVGCGCWLFTKPNLQAQPLIIDNTLTPEDLVQNVLLGDGVEVFNITYMLAPQSYGKFQDPSGILGCNEGIILTSGRTQNAIGPNNYPPNNGGTNNNFPGDPDLATLTNNPPRDASVLEFDFRTKSDTIRFQYIFASEEYPQYAPSPQNPSGSAFNDVFGFFLSGPGIPGTVNIAKIPGTNLPVSIFNVNVLNNSQFYRKNQSVTDPAYSVMDYNGYTVVLTAEYYPVTPCEVYHIKLAISDVQDRILDSGVFLQAKSFSSVGANIEPQGLVLENGNYYLPEGCAGGSGSFIVTRAFGIDQPAAFPIFFEGTATKNADYTVSTPNPDTIFFNAGQFAKEIYISSLFDGITESDETIILRLKYNSCGDDEVIDTLFIRDTSPLEVTASEGLQVCSGQTVTIGATATGGTGEYLFGWQHDGFLNVIAETDVTIFNDTTFYVTVFDYCDGVPTAQDSVQVTIIQPNPNAPAVVINSVTPNTTICPGEALTLTATASGGTESYLFSWNNGAASSSPNLNIAPTQTTTYTLVVSDGCSSTDTAVTITVLENIILNTTSDTLICYGGSANLEAFATGGDGNFTYAWSWNGGTATTQSIQVNPTQYTEYTLTVSSGCLNLPAVTKTVKVFVRPPLSVTARPDTTVCSGALVNLTATASGGDGNYTLTWYEAANELGSVNADSIPFAVNPLVQTTYTVQLSDSCGSIVATDEVTVFMIQSDLALTIISSSDTICIGQGVNLSGSATGGTGSYQYFWGNNPPGPSPAFFVTPTETTTYTLNASDGCGITQKDITIVVRPPLSVSVSDTILCNAGTATLTAVASGGDGNYFFEWGWPGGIGFVGNPLVITPNNTTAYTVELKDGCNTPSVTTTATVTLSATMVITPGNNQTICPGGSATLSVDVSSGTPPYQYVWSDENGVVGNTANLSVSPAVTTTYTVQITDACTTNPVSTTQTIQVFPGPNDPALALNSLSTPQYICNGQSITLSAQATGGTGTYTYNWTWQDGSAPTQTINVSPNTTTTFSLTYADACSNRDTSLTIYVHPALGLSVTADTTICFGGTAQLTATATGGKEDYQYNWNNGAGTTNNISVNPTTTTLYTVTLNDSCGTIQKSVLVTVLPELSLSVSNDTTICPNQTVSLVANVSGGGAPYIFTWETAAGQVGGNTAQLDVSPIETTTYTLTVTDNCNTPAVTASVTVTVLASGAPLELINLSPNDTTICKGTPLTLNANAQGGTGTYTYTWNWSNGTENSPIISLSPQTQDTYTITINDGCASVNASINVDIFPDLTLVSVSPDVALCDSSLVNLAIEVNGGNGNYFYIWSNGDTSASITVLPVAGSYSVTVSDGCALNTITQTINLIAAPPLVLQAPQNVTVCQGQAATLDIIVSGGDINSLSPITWTLNGNVIGTGDPFTFTPTQTGNYIATVSDACQTASIGVTVTVIGAGDMRLVIEPETPCMGETVKISMEGNPPQGAIPNWQFGPDLTLISGSVWGPFILRSNTVGTKTVKLKVQYGPCRDSVNQTFDYQALPLADFVAPQAQCLAENSFDFINLGTTGANTYQWTFTDITGEIISTSAEENPTGIQFDAPGTYYVNLLVIDNSCRDSIRKSIEVLAPPPAPQVNTTTVCAGFPARVKVLDPEPGFTYRWYLKDTDSTAVVVDTVFTYPNLAENMTFYVEAVNSIGCVSVERTPVTLKTIPLPEVDFIATPRVAIIPNAVVEFEIESSGQPVYAYWTFGDGTWSNSLRPAHQYLRAGSYEVAVTVTDTNGCTNSIVKPHFVRVEEPIHLIIPDAFTPNEDGDNDLFKVFHTLVTDFEIRIFARDGNLVYESRDVNFEWNGGLFGNMGQPLPEGVFVYAVKATFYNGRTEERKGTITLFR